MNKRKHNLLGQTFAFLTVEAEAGSGFWTCRCVCGKAVTCDSYKLRNGQRLSCGCQHTRRRTRTPVGLGGKKRAFETCRNNAKSRGLVFELTLDRFVQIADQDCFYCGSVPTNTATRGVTDQTRQHNAYRYNGVDRVDSSRGYVTGNMVPCCKTCNLAKNDLTTDEFLAWVKRISEHQRGRA